MRSSFFEYNVAITGIFTSRNAMDVINNNMANAKTEGYSRQVALQRTLKPLSGSGRGMIGTGSEVYDIKAIRNFYLDTKYWHQSSRLGEYTQKLAQSQAIEAILNEPSETSYVQYINNLFDSLQALSTDSGNSTFRTAFLGSCESLANVFNSSAGSLESLQSQINNEVLTIAERINELGREIQIYNKQICDLELRGKTANDLRDLRALAVDELSKYVNVEVKEVQGEHSTQFKVSINGEQFVDHYSLREITCVARAYKRNPEDVDGLYDILWKDSLSAFKVNSPTLTGELKGLIDMRDGNNGDYMTGKINSFDNTTLGDGRIQVTLDVLNRDDMQESGTININGTNYTYSNYVYDPVTKTATIEIPPSSGQIDFGTMRVSYTNLTINFSGDISFDIAPGLKIPSNPIIKIGDMKLEATDTSTDYSYVGGTFTITNPRVPVLNITALAVGSDVKVAVSNSYRGIPYYQKRLNEFVRNFASMLNDGVNRKGLEMGEGFTEGYDLYGDPGDIVFTYKDANGNEVIGGIANYALMTASNFTISSIIKADPKRLACSDSGTDESNNEIIKSLIEMRHNTSAFSEGTLSNYMESLIITAGIDTNIANDMESNQTDIINVFQNQRLSVMGVNLDEEAAFLIQYQQVFNACAKLVNVIDEIYNRLINGLGAF